jgi:hypothetical protein
MIGLKKYIIEATFIHEVGLGKKTNFNRQLYELNLFYNVSKVQKHRH